MKDQLQEAQTKLLDLIAYEIKHNIKLKALKKVFRKEIKYYKDNPGYINWNQLEIKLKYKKFYNLYDEVIQENKLLKAGIYKKVNVEKL